MVVALLWLLDKADAGVSASPSAVMGFGWCRLASGSGIKRGGSEEMDARLPAAALRAEGDADG
jgi:hypothetical protein